MTDGSGAMGGDAVAAWAAGRGLAPPPVPAPFSDRLRRLGDDVLTTRGDGQRPLNLGPLRDEFAAGEADDYLLLGVDGHGTSSWAMHWHCVRGPVAVFAQVRWGGVETQRPEDAARVAAVLRDADALWQRLAAADPLPAGRIEVVAADMSRCGVWTSDPDRAHGGGSGAADTLTFAAPLVDELLA